MLRWIKRLGFTLLAIWLLATLLTGPLLSTILFRSTMLPDDYLIQADHPFEEVFIDVDGGKLHALYFKPDSAVGVVLYYHGNRGSVERWSRVAGQFLERGYAVFLPDYRGYGKSRGGRSEEIFYSDAMRWRQWLQKEWPDTVVTVYGRSLGSAAATHVASKSVCRVLVLETPFASIPDVAYAHAPWLPHIFYFSYQFSNEDMITEVQEPVAIVVSGRDRVVPMNATISLKEGLKDGDEMLVVEGASHHNLRGYEEYRRFLDRWLGPIDGASAQTAFHF